jgi:hypothetical protein
MRDSESAESDLEAATRYAPICYLPVGNAVVPNLFNRPLHGHQIALSLFEGARPATPRAAIARL